MWLRNLECDEKGGREEGGSGVKNGGWLESWELARQGFLPRSYCELLDGQISMLSQILSARWKPGRTSSPFHIPPFKIKFLWWFLKCPPGPVRAPASIQILSDSQGSTKDSLSPLDVLGRHYASHYFARSKFFFLTSLLLNPFVSDASPSLCRQDRRVKFLAFLVRVGSGPVSGGHRRAGRGGPGRGTGASHLPALTGDREHREQWTQGTQTRQDGDTEPSVNIARHFTIEKIASEPCDHDMSDPQQVWASCNRIPLLFSCSELTSASPVDPHSLTLWVGAAGTKTQGCSQSTPFTVSFYFCILTAARKFPL